MQGTAKLTGKRLAKLLGAGVLAGLVATGCGSSADDQTRSSDQTLELYNWLLNPGEKEALQALVDFYRAHFPQTTVIKASGNSIGASLAQLQVRMQGVPPDTFQTVGGADLLQWVLANGIDDSESKLEPVDTLAASSGVVEALPQHVRNALSYGGSLYAVPVSVHRVNSLFYNAKIFQDLGLTPPTTLDEFYTVATAIKAARKIPLALGTAEGAIISDFLFDGLLIDKAGVAYREAYLTGQMDADPAGQPIMDALAELAKILDYTNDDRDSLLWPDAALKVVMGQAAMTYVGDWARGFFESTHMIPVDGVPAADATNMFGQTALFGTQDAFVYVVDAFTLPRGVLHRDAAVNFLGLLGAKDVEDVFDPPKGSIPPRLDADRAIYDHDPLANKTFADFGSKTLTLSRIPLVKSVEFKAELEQVIRQFAIDKKVDTVKHFLKNRYDEL